MFRLGCSSRYGSSSNSRKCIAHSTAASALQQLRLMTITTNVAGGMSGSLLSSFNNHNNNRRFYATNSSSVHPTRGNDPANLTNISSLRGADRVLPALDESGLGGDPLLRCLRKEMEDEALRMDKEDGPPQPPKGWDISHITGTSFFTAQRMWMPPPIAVRREDIAASTTTKGDVRENSAEGNSKGDNSNENNNNNNTNNNASQSENTSEKPKESPYVLVQRKERHTVRVQLTSRDPSLDPECDIRGEHFPFSLFIEFVDEHDAVLRATSTPSSESEELPCRMPTGPGTVEVHGSDKSSPSSSTSPNSSSTNAHHTTTTTSNDNNNNNNNNNGWGDMQNVWSSGNGDVLAYTPPEDTSSIADREREDDAFEASLYSNSIEVRCDFVDGELVSNQVVFHPPKNGEPASALLMANWKTRNNTENNIFSVYPGPNLDEAEEEILDGLQAWLAERNIDDQFGEFVGQYSVWVEQMEYERWLRQFYSFVAM